MKVEGHGGRFDTDPRRLRALAFPDAHFDRVISFLCLHNIEGDADRARACREIACVLAPGGKLVIGDYIPTDRYVAALAGAGLQVVQSHAAFTVALSLMWMVVATKSEA